MPAFPGFPINTLAQRAASAAGPILNLRAVGSLFPVVVDWGGYGAASSGSMAFHILDYVSISTENLHLQVY